MRIQKNTPPFRLSLNIQLRVLHALFLREMISHFGRHNIGFLWMFVEPMMFTIGITTLWYFMAHHHGSMPIAGFALTGYSSIVAWRNCVSKTSIAVRANMGLLYHRNVTIFDLGVTRGIFEFSAVTVSFMILSIFFSCLNLMTFPVDILKVIYAWLLMGWFFIAAGLLALYLDHKSELFHKFMHVFMYLSLPFTGAFAMVSWLPLKLQHLYLLSPMVNGIEMMREGYFGTSVNAHYSIAYLISFNIGLSFIALAMISKVKRLVTLE